MFKRFAALAVLGLLCFACTMTAPVARQIQNSFPIDKPFDPVWQALIEIFGDLNLPIMNLEKASGLITTDKIDFAPNLGYSDCGGLSFMAVEYGRSGKFNVYVKKTSENSCEVRVNATFESRYGMAGGNETFTRNCISTGKLEAEIFKRVQEKVK